MCMDVISNKHEFNFQMLVVCNYGYYVYVRMNVMCMNLVSIQYNYKCT